MLAQKLLEQSHWPYLSIDHLKMGLIRSGKTELTPLSEDADLTAYLWPVVREMIKTAVENGQHLIVEGCYIPFDWRRDFDDRTVYPDSLFGHQKKRPAGAGRQKETVASDEAWVTADPNTDPRRVTGPAGETCKEKLSVCSAGASGAPAGGKSLN